MTTVDDVSDENVCNDLARYPTNNVGKLSHLNNGSSALPTKFQSFVVLLGKLGDNLVQCNRQGGVVGRYRIVG